MCNPEVKHIKVENLQIRVLTDFPVHDSGDDLQSGIEFDDMQIVVNHRHGYSVFDFLTNEPLPWFDLRFYLVPGFEFDPTSGTHLEDGRDAVIISSRLGRQNLISCLFALSKFKSGFVPFDRKTKF